MAATAANDLHVPDENDARIIEIRASATGHMGQADMIVIDSNEMYEIANDMLATVHSKSKELEARKQSITKPMNEALTAVRRLFKPAEEALDVAKSTLKRKMIDYQSQVEAERRKAEAEAERQRQEEIAAAAAEAAAAEAAVERAVESGDTEAFVEASNAMVRAEDKQLEAEVATPHVVATARPSSGGHAMGKTWKAEVTDLPAFLRFMADELEKGDQRFDKTLDLKLGQLHSFGKATKGTVSIPGVTFHEEKTLAAR